MVLVSSFNPLALWYTKWLDKNIRTGFLYENPKFLFLKNIIHPDCVHPKESLVTKNLVKHCKDRGLSINVWTSNNNTSIDWLSKLGVDGIITDNPKYRFCNKRCIKRKNITISFLFSTCIPNKKHKNP